MGNEWFVHFPGNMYAFEFYGETEADARQSAREWLGKKRLPAGTSVWKKNGSHDGAMATDVENNPDLYLYS